MELKKNIEFQKELNKLTKDKNGKASDWFEAFDNLKEYLLKLKKDRVVVFCEVKTRIAGIFGDGREAVDLRKQNKIKRCAEMFLLSTGIAYDYCEFHVIEITAEHLKNCF